MYRKRRYGAYGNRSDRFSQMENNDNIVAVAIDCDVLSAISIFKVFDQFGKVM